MKTINVVRSFILTDMSLNEHPFSVGLHHVENWVAEHWWTKIHTEEFNTVDDDKTGDTNNGEDGGGAAGTPGEGPTDQTIATMNVSEIEDLLEDQPALADRVEQVESSRDNPRAGVRDAVADAREVLKSED